MKILVLDNYDSFTYNLVYIIKKYCSNTHVVRNDKITPEDCLVYDALVLSPGPGIPQGAGRMPEIISYCAGKIPILGVCLGHQAIAEHLGADLINMQKVYHGVESSIELRKSLVFKGLEKSISVGRYHSWTINPETLTDLIQVTAVSEEDKSIMAIENNSMKLYGLQFHPESILTKSGNIIIQNFLQLVSQQ